VFLEDPGGERCTTLERQCGARSPQPGVTDNLGGEDNKLVKASLQPRVCQMTHAELKRSSVCLGVENQRQSAVSR